MCSSFLECLAHPLASILIGSTVTWFVAWFYYKRAGDELRKEAELLQKAQTPSSTFLSIPVPRLKHGVTPLAVSLELT